MNHARRSRLSGLILAWVVVSWAALLFFEIRASEERLLFSLPPHREITVEDLMQIEDRELVARVALAGIKSDALVNRAIEYEFKRLREKMLIGLFVLTAAVGVAIRQLWRQPPN